MNIPGFTAEATLHKTSGHYQTGRHAINSHIQVINVVHPTMEVIEVYGCSPGLIQLGEGENMVCINPSSVFANGGPIVSPPKPPGGGGGGGGGGSKNPLERCGCNLLDYLCRFKAQLNRSKHEACENAIEQCFDDYCKGLKIKARGDCQNSCVALTGEKDVCKADPCFEGIPCRRRIDGTLDCKVTPGCPGTYGKDEECL